LQSSWISRKITITRESISKAPNNLFIAKTNIPTNQRSTLMAEAGSARDGQQQWPPLLNLGFVSLLCEWSSSCKDGNSSTFPGSISPFKMSCSKMAL